MPKLKLRYHRAELIIRYIRLMIKKIHLGAGGEMMQGWSRNANTGESDRAEILRVGMD